MKNSEPASSFSLIAGCARSAFSLKTLVPVWLWLLASCWAANLAPPRAAPWAAWCVIAVGFFPTTAWVSLCAVRDAASAKPLGSTEIAVRTFRSLVPLCLSVLFTLLTPALFLATAFAVSLVGEIPRAGPWLLGVWMATGGLLFAFLAAAWIVVGLPAVLLQPAAAVTEYPDSMEIASRTLSYVRRRPMLLAAASLGALASALAGTAVFGVFTSLAIAFLLAMADVGAGLFPDPALFLGQVESLWREPGITGPFGKICAAIVSPPGADGSLPAWASALGRLVPAFFVAALSSGLARAYLVLRRSVDGVPPSRVYEG